MNMVLIPHPCLCHQPCKIVFPFIKQSLKNRPWGGTGDEPEL